MMIRLRRWCSSRAMGSHRIVRVGITALLRMEDKVAIKLILLVAGVRE